MGGPSQASTTLGLTAKISIYSSNTFSFSAGLVWPILASRRSAAGVSSSSTSFFFLADSVCPFSAIAAGVQEGLDPRQVRIVNAVRGCNGCPLI